MWMMSLGGVEFITQENIMSWPTSFFMKTYGKFWLATTGLSLSAEAFIKGASRTAIFLGAFQGVLLPLTWRGTNRRILFLRSVLFLGALSYLIVYLRSDEILRYAPLILTFQDAVRYLFFPQDMVLYIALIAIFAWWNFWKNPAIHQSAAVALRFCDSCF